MCCHSNVLRIEGIPFSLIPEAEVIVVVQDVIQEFSRLLHRNYYVRLNHTSLLRAALLFVGIPESSHSAVLVALTEVKVRNKTICS